MVSRMRSLRLPSMTSGLSNLPRYGSNRAVLKASCGVKDAELNAKPSARLQLQLELRHS
ncbi:hypothetical protein IG631_15707 [Alternaria alternata]|nr:hypothetical protein IG631_15707 [Alternaria alternata]